MPPRSLSGRLLLAAAAGLAAAGLAAGLLIWLGPLLRSPDQLLHVELEDEVADLQAGLRIDPSGILRVRLDRNNARVYDAMPKDAAYQILDADGHYLAQSPDGPALQALRAMQAGIALKDAPLMGGDGRLRLVQQAIRHGDKTYQVRVARSDRLVRTLRGYADKMYLRALTATVVLALATFALVVVLTVRKLVKPLRQASELASGIGPRNLAARLHVAQMPSELAPLVEAFNAALERLERGYRVQQEFLAAAAHELKTPLALLQAEIELGGAANPELLLRDTMLMARQVHQLLHLAEVSEGHNYSFASIDPGSVLVEVVDYFERLAGQRNVHLSFARASRALDQVEGDTAALFVLAKNLLENALNHAPAGSVVRVQLTADGFFVEDEGRGVAAEDRPRLFQRFWRAQREGNGAGLGLAICQEICLAHGWSIALVEGKTATGARFQVVMNARTAG